MGLRASRALSTTLGGGASWYRAAIFSRRSPQDSRITRYRQKGTHKISAEGFSGAGTTPYLISTQSPPLSRKRRRQTGQRCKMLKERNGNSQPQFGHLKGRNRSSVN